MHDKDQCSINTNKTVPNWIVMGENSFFKKVISYLAELSKGKHSLLVDSGWLSLDEAHRVIVILSHLGFIEKNGEEYIEKGAKFYEERYRAKTMQYLQKKALQMGCQIVEMPIEERLVS